MSDPFKKIKDPVHGAGIEVISGMSALNMPPDPIRNSKGEFLSETDRMVKHSMVHFKAAMDYLRRAENVQESIDAAIGLLEVKQTEMALKVLKIVQKKMKG